MSFTKPSFRFALTLCLGICVLTSMGCSQLRYWKANNFKVGPNYARPTAPVAAEFSQSDSPAIRTDQVLDPQWWQVFNDPDLNDLIDSVYRQNLTLKQATWRIEEARALLAAQQTTILPQQNFASGGYTRSQNNALGAPVSSDRWQFGFNSAWELDLWGRIRRNIDASEAQLQAAVKDYDFALVSLIGDVASLYINIRSVDERIALAEKNVESFRGSLKIAKVRLEEEVGEKLDVIQAESNMVATQALIPRLEFARQQSLKSLAVLLGIPPSEVESLDDNMRGLPDIPAEVMVGIPAELLCRRPDIRSAERLLRANFEAIGITEADLYPSLSISGNLGYGSAEFRDLFSSSAFNGSIGPSFNWNVLNFGRIRQQVRANEARYNQLKFDFENRVLTAQQEVETSMIEFVKTQEEYQLNLRNEQLTAKAADIAMTRYKEGEVDFGRVFVAQSNLVQVQDGLIANRASIAQALINTYRSLGGGWDYRGGTTQVAYRTGTTLVSRVRRAMTSDTFDAQETPAQLVLEAVPVLDSPDLDDIKDGDFDANDFLQKAMKEDAEFRDAMRPEKKRPINADLLVE